MFFKTAESNNFYNKFRECNHQKLFYEENVDQLLQKQNDRQIHFKEILRNYFEIATTLKAWEENFINTK